MSAASARRRTSLGEPLLLSESPRFAAGVRRPTDVRPAAPQSDASQPLLSFHRVAAPAGRQNEWGGASTPVNANGDREKATGGR
jgi:hypothetical protein